MSDKHSKAYAKGVEDAKNAGLIEEISDGIGDIIANGVNCIAPLESSEHQSYEAGYHDQLNGNVK